MGLKFEGDANPAAAYDEYQGSTSMLEGNSDVEKVNYNLLETVAYGGAGMIANVADSMFEAVTEDDVEAALSMVGKPLGEFYSQNKLGIQMTGDIAFSFVPGIGATKLIQAPGVLAKAVRKASGNNKYLMSMFSTGKSIHQLTNPAIRKAMRTGVKTRGKEFADDALRMKARRAVTADLLKEGLAADIAIAATMGDSQVFFPDEMSAVETAVMFGVPTLGIAGLGNLATRSVLKTRLMKEVAPAMAVAENPLDLNRTEAFFHPGNRGTGITMLAYQKAELESALAESTDKTLSANLTKELNVVNVELQKQAYLLLDEDFLKGVTASENLKPPQANIPPPKEVNTVIAALKSDANYMFDAISLQTLDSAAAKNFVARKAASIESIDKELKALSVTMDDARKAGTTVSTKDLKASDKLVARKNLTEQLFNVVLEPTGELSLHSQRKALWQDGTRKTFRTQDKLLGDATMAKIPKPNGKKLTVGIGDDFNLRMDKRQSSVVAGLRSVSKPSQAGFASLNLFDRSAVFGLYQNAIEKYKPGTAIVLAPSDHWSKKEAALALMQSGKAKGADIQLPSGVASKDDLQLQILHDKFDEFQRVQNLVWNNEKKIFKQPASSIPNQLDLTRLFNLPGADSNGESGLVKLFNELYVPGKRVSFKNVIRDKAQLDEAMMRMTAPAEMPELTMLNNNPRLRGKMMDIDSDKNPVAMIAANPKMGTSYVGRETLNAAVKDARTTVVNSLKLADREGANIVGAVANSITARPDMYLEAKQVALLRHGSAKQTDAFVQGTFANRDNTVLQATDIITDLSEKEMMQIIKAKFKPHAETFSMLQSKNYSGDLQSLALTRHSLGQGWDMADDIERLQGGAVQMFIDPASTFNKKRWSELYPDTPFPNVAKGQLIPLPQAFSSEPLQTSQLAFAGVEALTGLSAQVLREINYVNKVQGRPPIQAKAWHMPAKDLSDKELIFLVDGNQKLHSVIGGQSYKAAKREADNAVANSDQTLIQLNSDDVARYFDLQNEAFARPSNYAYAQRQTGRATGKSFSSTIEMGPEVLQSMVTTIQKQMESVGKQTRGLLFEPELGFAKRQLGSSDATVAAMKRQTPWDYYANRVMGAPTLNKNTSFGKIYYGIESIYDEKMQSAIDRLAELGKQGGVTKKQAAEYKALTGTGISPFDDITDFVEKTTRIQVPQTLRKHAAVLNYTAAALALRIADVGMGLINTMSLAATIPPVIKMMQKMDTESVSEWHKRINAFGSPVSDANAIMNPTKTVTSAMHFWYSDEGRDVLNRAAKKGLIQQEVAERLSVIVAPQHGYVANLVKDGIDKLSWITDKTEIMSRGTSFITGYYMATRALKLNDEAAMAFAHNFANKSIGDYRPSNRPQMFQGAAGLPLGLFTTFMMNFLQRVYGTIENKQMGAVLNQVGMQTLLFGTNSLPGFDAYIQNLTDNYDGSVNMVDRLTEAYGEAGANVMLHGPVSAFTGVNIASRGDITMPFSREGGLVANVPSFSMVSNTFKMMGELTDNLIYNKGFSPVQAGETIQQYSINRFTRSMMDMWHGYSIDKRGSMLESDLYTPEGVLSRVLGFKTLQEHGSQMDKVRTRLTNLKQADLRDSLRESFSAATRDLKYGSKSKEKFNANVERALGAYMKSGGKPKNFGNYIKQMVMRSQVDSSQLALLDAISAQNSDGNLARLLLLQQNEE